MRDFKIFIVIVFFTLATYWGVEPFAHSQMHPHVEPADFKFNDLNVTTEGVAGNVENGAALVAANCIACHAIEKAGFPATMDNASAAASYGVVPPDLSTAGALYDAKFLSAFIADPATATKTAHKYVDGKVHPMPSYNWMQPQELADMVAYLQSIAPKTLTNKEVYQNACQRCHSIKYGDMTGGTMAAFTPAENIKAYMGKMPPDLSQYIKSRGEHYLETFINNPQKHLEGTAMPRVGLNENAQKQVISYMEEVGDRKKDERNGLGPIFLAYLAVFAIVAWLWKNKIWREVH